MRRGHPRFYELIDEICELHEKKNSDYAKDDNPLSNFKRAASLGVEPWRGVLVRMSDKWSRIEELSKGKTPQNESLRDSLIDLAVYALIDIVLLEEDSGTTMPPSSTPSVPRASSVDRTGILPIRDSASSAGTVE